MNATFAAAYPRVPLERQAVLMRRLNEYMTASSLIGLDLDGNIRSWSDGAHAMHAYEEHEVIGVNAALLEDADGPRVFARALEHAKLTGKWTGSIAQRSQLGARVACELTLLLLRDAAGRPEGLAAVLRDVGEAARLERQLRASLAAGHRLLESDLDLVLVANSAGYVVEANRFACATLGVVEPSPFSLARLLVDSSALPALLEGTRIRDELHGVELALITMSGGVVDLCCDTLAVAGPNGDNDHVMIVARPRENEPHSAFRLRAAGPVAARRAPSDTLRVA